MAELETAPYKSATAYADSIDTEVKCLSGNEGTALELARAAEDADRNIARIEQSADSVAGDNRLIRVYMTRGAVDDMDLEKGPVPDSIHDQLVEWGYEPATDVSIDASHHVYAK